MGILSRDDKPGQGVLTGHFAGTASPANRVPLSILAVLVFSPLLLEPHVGGGFEAYTEVWRESQIARGQSR